MSKFTCMISLVAFAAAVILFACSAHAGIIGYWDFEGNGNDQSVNNNHGTVGGSMTYESNTPAPLTGSTRSLRSYVGGGVANVVSVPTSASLESINDSVAISFWMNSNLGDNSNWWRLFQHGNEANGSQSWLVNRYSGNNEVNVRVDTINPGGQFNQNIVRGGPNPYDGTWHHMIFSMDSGLWRKFVDGNMVGQGSYNHGQGLSNTRDLYMFGRNNTGEYVGMLDDVAIYDQPIAWNQAEYLYGGGDPLNLPAAQTLPLLGIGPEGGPGFWGIREVHGNGTIGGIGAVIASLQSGGGTITDSTSYNVINFGNGGEDGTGNPYIGGSGNDFAQIANGYVKIETAGDYTFYARGDDGFQLRIFDESWDSVSDTGSGTALIFDDTLLNGSTGGNVNGYGVINLDAGVYELEYLFFERAGGEYNELWSAQGIFSSFNINDFALVGDTQNGGLELVGAPVIPEPTTWVIFALGLLGLGYHARRRR